MNENRSRNSRQGWKIENAEEAVNILNSLIVIGMANTLLSRSSSEPAVAYHQTDQMLRSKEELQSCGEYLEPLKRQHGID